MSTPQSQVRISWLSCADNADASTSLEEVLELYIAALVVKAEGPCSGSGNLGTCRDPQMMAAPNAHSRGKLE